MKDKKNDLLQGTLDLLVLKSLALGPLHGLGVSNRIAQITQGTFQVKPGSLFPALRRLEQRGWIEGEWAPSENGRRARYYRLTAAGRRALRDELESWRRFAAGLEAVLRTS